MLSAVRFRLLEPSCPPPTETGFDPGTGHCETD